MLRWLILVFSRLGRKEVWNKLGREEILKCIVSHGVENLSIIFLGTGTAGILITRELGHQMHHALNSIEMVPGFTGQFVLRELGVIIPCILLSAKSGAAIAAELSSMKVTEQIDALKLMEIDEITYLVIPRFIGCAIAGSCLTLISIFSSLFCAMLTAIWSYQFSCVEYVNVMAKFLKPSDLLLGLLKGSLYGAVIPLIACYNGINCKQGAQEVGTVTTNSVVYSMAMIIILDFIVTYLFAIFYF